MPIGIVSTVLGWLHVRRAFLVILVISGVGGYLWVRFHEVAVERDRIAAQRDAFGRWIDVACAGAGSRWVTGTEPKGAHPGDACGARIAALATEEHDAAIAAANALAAAMHDHDAKTASDAAAGAAASAATLAATQRMEAQNARIKGTHVDGAWFGALNDAARLQPGS